MTTPQPSPPIPHKKKTPVWQVVLGVAAAIGLSIAFMVLKARDKRYADAIAKQDALIAKAAEPTEEEKREALGYIEDPELKAVAEEAILDRNFTCPGVHGLRKIGQVARGNLFRVHCKNNIMYELTITPDGRAIVKPME